MNAYSDLYLSSAQIALGGMLDYAVYDLKWELGDFYRAFINSGIAHSFGTGEPKYTVGMSGIEIAQEVVRIATGRDVDTVASCPFERSPEYWAGWAVAYYEWCRCISFDRIDRSVPITEIVDMYHPYHEMDVTAFADELDRRLQERAEKSQLARLRAYAGLTQKALADRSGVSVRMIQQYEQGISYRIRQLRRRRLYRHSPERKELHFSADSADMKQGRKRLRFRRYLRRLSGY